MALHVDRGEYHERLGRVGAAMAACGLDGLLLFEPASHYWLTGYDTFGYCFFQCLVVRADGQMVLLTRAPDLRQARQTSVIDDIRVWVDREGASGADDLVALLDDFGLGRSGPARPRLGVEFASHGLTAAHGRRLEAALGGRATLIDTSDLITRLRVIKSAAELTFVRRAGRLADAALEAAIAETRAGADEGRILARLQGTVFEGGGDYPGNPTIIGSGPDALLCRYKSGRRTLAADDQLTLELAGTYRHYHACLMRTLIVGRPRPRHLELFGACREALLACEARLRPGTPLGHVFAAHAEVLDRRGLAAHRLHACGYALGAVYPPSWMDWPMIHAGNPVELEVGMVMFLHMILMDSDSGTAMTLGRTSIIGVDGPEPLSALPLDLIVR